MSGGGAYQCTVGNCILYYNSAPGGTNWSGGSTLNYCCTLPLPSGSGNITNEPQLSDLAHLSAGSPCRGAGSVAYASGLDLDGQAWSNPPAMGCNEFDAATLSGPLSLAIQASYNETVPGFMLNFIGSIAGQAVSNSWDFGDGTILNNRLYVTHVWSAAGDYPVVFRAYNNSNPAGAAATIMIHVSAQLMYYVDPASATPVPPYASWSTAATNIQDAVDAAVPTNGSVVLVADGVYQSGGRVVSIVTNRLVVNKPIKVQSANGPAAAIIKGYQVPGAIVGSNAIRCVYLGTNATLTGFTLFGGGTVANYQDCNGGGVLCVSSNCLVVNCRLISNSAASYGGGAATGTLVNCTLLTNSASQGGGGACNCGLRNCSLLSNFGGEGGGAYSCILSNCYVVGNRGGFIGGAVNCSLYNSLVASNYITVDGIGGLYECTLNNCTVVANSGITEGALEGCTAFNCIIYYNTAGPYSSFSNHDSGSLLYNCCTAPTVSGAGNITNPPLFLNMAGGNYRLQSNSPCIGTGFKFYAPGTLDLDGRPRIIGGKVDMGAYESQPGISGLFIAWLQQYGLPTDGSADFVDSDGDGMNNWQEWIAGTDPTNAASALRMQPLTQNPPGLLLQWSSDSAHSYFVQRALSLASPLTFSTLTTNVPGLNGASSFLDTTAPGLPAAYYRVGTSATSPPSSLSLQMPAFIPPSLTVSWTSVTNRFYSVLRATNLSQPPGFVTVQSNIGGQPSTTSFLDTNAPDPGPYIYKVQVYQ